MPLHEEASHSVYFPAKVLLLGEHILLQGARALAAPLSSFGGHWALASPTDAPCLQMHLVEWLAYLADLPDADAFDLEAFRQDLLEGLYFRSNIPTGYGLGSSGALCAAFYHRYARQRVRPEDTVEWPVLRRLFAQMEGYFHGASSGADPLIAYLGRPVILEPQGGIQAVQLPALVEQGLCLFLLDSNQSRQTGAMVQYFKTRCADPAFAQLVRDQLMAASNTAIQAWTENRLADFAQAFLAVSEFQLAHLPAMVPEALQAPWRCGLRSGAFALKLCGAGGGGMFLGLATDWEATTKALAAWKLQEI